jgi:hypothetical protein
LGTAGSCRENCQDRTARVADWLEGPGKQGEQRCGEEFRAKRIGTQTWVAATFFCVGNSIISAINLFSRRKSSIGCFTQPKVNRGRLAFVVALEIPAIINQKGVFP